MRQFLRLPTAKNPAAEMCAAHAGSLINGDQPGMRILGFCLMGAPVLEPRHLPERLSHEFPQP